MLDERADATTTWSKLGQHISFTERRSEDAERELRQVKLLELLQKHVGEEFTGVVTGITNFGLFVQLQPYLIDGLIRYENLMDDWWDVDERGGVVRGQRTGHADPHRRRGRGGGRPRRPAAARAGPADHEARRQARRPAAGG